MQRGLAELRVNLKPNTSLHQEVWCEVLLCGCFLTLYFIPPLYYICTVTAEDWKTKKKAGFPLDRNAPLHCKIWGVCVCWRDHDLTSCPTPSDMLLGVPAVLTLKELPWETPDWQMQQSPPNPSNKSLLCGIIVKQALSLLSAATCRREEDGWPEEWQKTLNLQLITAPHCIDSLSVCIEYHMEDKRYQRQFCLTNAAISLSQATAAKAAGWLRVCLFASRKRFTQEKTLYVFQPTRAWMNAFSVLIRSYRESKHFCIIKVRCDKLEMHGMAGLHWVCEGVWCSSKQRRAEQMLSAHKAEWKVCLYTTSSITVIDMLVLTAQENQWLITN